MKRSSTSASSIRLPQGARLGDWTPHLQSFPDLESIFKEFTSSPCVAWPEHMKIEKINRTLLGCIQKVPAPCFLLPSIIDYIDRIVRHNILSRYTMASFELYLNEFSGLSPEENYAVRGKIVGKWIPRNHYQVLFPVSHDKYYPGSHFVTAHGAPDLDTTIASFWGWVDAFGCRIGEKFHVWNVPGGPPEGQVEINFLFHQIFGPNLFQHLAKTRTGLGVTGLDLMTQKGMVKKVTAESARDIDYEGLQHAVLLIDEGGFYVGDWRNFDVEGVRQMVILLCNSLQWYGHFMQAELVKLFGREELHADNVRGVVDTLHNLRIKDYRPAKEMTGKQREHLHDFLSQVLGISEGVEANFTTFAHALEKLHVADFRTCLHLLESLSTSNLFDKKGNLIENRPLIFQYLEKVMENLGIAIERVSSYVDRLDVALNIKTRVFGYQPQFVSSRADLEEIRNKIGTYPYLTITGSDPQGKLTPLGIVPASELYRPILGTVSLRDFCNREETKIPSYLEVISVIDHHKGVLQTSSAPVAIISNAQSSNSMVAEVAFAINDAFSTAGMTKEELSQQIEEVMQNFSSPTQKRILRRLLQRKITEERSEPFFIAPFREFVEYLHFIYAILDDTDLLTKVSMRDIDCMATLLNRLKSLSLGRETEIVHFDDLARDKNFVARAALRLLQNEDLYSLYHKIYIEKEEAVEKNIHLCAEGKDSSLFADTKIQNSYCRVGQTKMFAKNFSFFNAHVARIRARWLQEAFAFQHERPECDLHLHMISTLAGADDLFHGTMEHNSHPDELWMWIPMIDTAIEHLKSFLNSFRSLPPLQLPETELEFLGKNSKELDQIFTESFLPIPRKTGSRDQELSMAILRFKAGTINSRKAQIAPFLPRQMV